MVAAAVTALCVSELEFCATDRLTLGLVVQDR
jgi:hypothetical protein